jgi:hypothetical protein
MRPGRHRRATVIGALAAAALAVGVAVSHGDAPANTAARLPAAPASHTSTTTRGAGPPRTPVGSASSPMPAAGPRDTASPPVHLSIAAIGVSTDLMRLGLLADGSLQPPARWAQAGWYADGIVPGQVGPAVIVGHIDSTNGPAVFYRLGELRAGSPITVTLRNHAVLRFVVDRMQRFRKSRFPTTTVYGPTPDPELRLVTCTGRFDRQARSYVDNLVVSAHLG